MVIKLTPVPNSKGKLPSVSRFYSASKLLKWSDSLSNVIASKCNQLTYFCCSNIEKRYFSWICQFSLHWHESEKSNQNWRIFFYEISQCVTRVSVTPSVAKILPEDGWCYDRINASSKNRYIFTGEVNCKNICILWIKCEKTTLKNEAY